MELLIDEQSWAYDRVNCALSAVALQGGRLGMPSALVRRLIEADLVKVYRDGLPPDQLGPDWPFHALAIRWLLRALSKEIEAVPYLGLRVGRNEAVPAEVRRNG